MGIQTYFISNGANIKIGKSMDPYERLKSLGSMTTCSVGLIIKFELLLIVDGDHEYEYHSKFCKSRIIGEWFEPSEDLLSFIRQIRIQEGISGSLETYSRLERSYDHYPNKPVYGVKEQRPRKKREFHGMTHTDEYRAWYNMVIRCENPGCKNYFGKGIRVCERWRESFMNFYKDLGPIPEVGMILKRKDTSKNYEFDNCYWADESERCRGNLK